MPRQARRKSNSGIYHIMLRGINKQVIFEEDEDYLKLIETLVKYKKICGYKIYAYCLMSNHVHLLLKTEKEDLETIFRRIAGSYVYWYNFKYRRSGHLFQDRYKSEPVENNEYFLTVFRYIHQNSLNIVSKIEDYKYSSYNDYILANCKLTDVSFALSIMSKENLLTFVNEENSDKCLEYEEKVLRPNDVKAGEIIFRITKCKNVQGFQELDKNARDEYLKKIKGKGLSIRQISRLTGVSFGIVRNIR